MHSCCSRPGIFFRGENKRKCLDIPMDFEIYIYPCQKFENTSFSALSVLSPFITAFTAQQYSIILYSVQYSSTTGYSTVCQV